MKRIVLLSAASLLLSTSLWAQPYGGMGMGPGMMGSYGMGPGMMGGYGLGPWSPGAGYEGLKLTPEQRQKIQSIQEETANAMWTQMSPMHQKGWHMGGLYGPGALDEAQARSSYQSMSEAHKAMFELQLEARKRMDAVLTPAQREQLRRP